MWKKKVDDSYNDDKLNKFLCVINSISNLSRNNSIVLHEGLKVTWKVSAISYGYDLVKNDISYIKTGILDFIEKKRRIKEKSKKIVKIIILF